MRRMVGRIAAVGTCLVLVAVSGGSGARRAESAPPSVAFRRLPLGFEPNQGQAAPGAEFLARGRGYAVTLTRGDAVLALAGATVRMHPLGANPAPEVAPEALLAGRVHYLIGRDAARWRTGIPTYGRVRYRDVYPGIDLVYYGNQRQLEYDFVVSPGADAGAIRLTFEGADRLTLDDGGALRLTAAGGAIVLEKPTIYQEGNGARRVVPGGFVLHAGSQVTFWIGAYDRARPLVIDPVLAWSTYLGGSGMDGANAIAVDAAGHVYVTGGTGVFNSPSGPQVNDFPATAGAVSPSMPRCGSYPFWGCDDVFVAKLAGDGSGLVWATYLGGADSDEGLGIAVDAARQVYVTGSTQSGSFPAGGEFPTTPGAYRTTRPHGGCGHGGCSDGFVAKLTADGSALVYGSYLGGGNVGHSAGSAIAVDGAGNAYVTGAFSPPSAPVQHHFDPSRDYTAGAFVLKVGPTGALVYSSDFGSGTGTGIAVDSGGHAHVTGTVHSGFTFPTINAVQPVGGGGLDAFVAKLSPDGASLVYSTFLGGSSEDGGGGIVVDGAGQAYVTGSSQSADFPTTPGALTAGASGGAFVSKLDAAGARLYSAVLANGRGIGIAADGAGHAYVTGDAGAGFPTVDPVRAAPAGGTDVFVARLNPTGSALVYSTYLGGTANDFAGGIAIDGAGAAWVAGTTESADFPTAGPFQAGLRGSSDAFVAKLVEGTQATALADVSAGHWARPWIEALYAARVTGGCATDPLRYCPDSPVTREQMAVFLLRSKEGPSYTPPPCTSAPFSDVPCSSPFAPWISELVSRGVTAGCGGGRYCPTGPVTRAQMAVFLLRTSEGSGFTPPACTVPAFADVPCSSPFAPWSAELARRGITAGCGGGNYCPQSAVTRAQMAVFLVETFNLPV